MDKQLLHEQLLHITFHLPCKTIAINGEDYLQRYYLGEQLGYQYWLHRFLRNDSERHLHSHPWSAISTIICGSYTEERSSTKLKYMPGHKNNITPDTLHRIVAVEPNTWTLMRVSPERLPEWYFIDDQGNKTPMRTSELDWHTKYKTRNGKLPSPNGALVSVIQLMFEERNPKEAA